LGQTKCPIQDLQPHPFVSMYHRGLTVFIKDHPEGYETGTVVDVDLRRGKLLLAVPETRDFVAVYPHMITPVAQRSYWNFHTRGWVHEPVPLPSGKVSKAVVPDEAAEEEQVGQAEEPVEKEVEPVAKEADPVGQEEPAVSEEKIEIKVEGASAGKGPEIEPKDAEENEFLQAVEQLVDEGDDDGQGGQEEVEESKSALDIETTEEQTETETSSPKSVGSESESLQNISEEKKEEEIPVGEIQVRDLANGNRFFIIT